MPSSCGEHCAGLPARLSPAPMVRGDDDRAVVGEAQREVLAVAALAVGQEEEVGCEDEAADQQWARQRGAGWQCRGGGRVARGRRHLFRFVDRQFNSAGVSSSY